MPDETTLGEQAPEEQGPYPDILNLTVVQLRRFIFVVRAISDNKMWPEVEKHLNSRGCDSLVISLGPIAEIQELLLQRRAANRVAPGTPTSSAGGTDRRLDRFIVSGCGTPPHYPPRPPDDWPEGPWDPPVHVQ